MSWLWSIWLRDGLFEHGRARNERGTSRAVAEAAISKAQAAPAFARAPLGGRNRGMGRAGAFPSDVRNGVLRIRIERLVTGLRSGA